MHDRLFFVKELFLFQRKKVILIVCAIILTIISFIFFIRFLFFPFTGLIIDKPEIVTQNNKIIFLPRFLYSPAITAGLQSGDIITKINNIPVTGVKAFINTVYHLKTFSLITIEFQRDNNIFQLFIQPELMLLKIDWIFTFLLACVLAIIGFIILIYINDQKYYPFTLALFLYLLSICVKPFFYESFFSFLLFNISTISIFLLPVFSLYFPKPWFIKKIRVCLILIIIVFNVIYVWFASFYYVKTDIIDNDHWLSLLESLGIIKHIAEVIAIISFLLILFFSYLKCLSKQIRNQIGWIITGFVLAFSPYFFFEQLPLLIGNMVNEKISLGNFSHIFICIFPIFFLIGLFTHKREKFKHTIPVFIYYLFVIPLFLFLFLLISKPIHSYLIIHYGFSASSAYLFTAFLYVLCMQPILILGMKIIDKIINVTKYKKSLHYISCIEKENVILKEKYMSQLYYNNAQLQAGKLTDLTTIIKGIHAIVYKSTTKISKSLLVVQEKLKIIMQFLKDSRLWDDIEMEENRVDINKPINDITLENLKIKELITDLNKNIQVKPSLPSWIGSELIIHKIITKLKKIYPYININTIHVTDHYFYCCPSHIIYAFIYIISYLFDNILPQETDISIKSYKKESLLIIEIEYWNRFLSQDYLKNIFEPFDKKQQNKEYKGLNLYIPKVLIEKNSGIISTNHSENKTQFIAQFLLEKKI